MSGRFNEPRLMGNCINCYYYTPKPRKDSDEGVCHRYPKALEKGHGDYCGEFAWNHDASLIKGASE